MKACHWAALVLTRIQLASDAQLVTCLVALDSEDHEKVSFDCLGDIVVR